MVAPSLDVADDSVSELGKGPLPAFIKEKVMFPSLYGAFWWRGESKGNILIVEEKQWVGYSTVYMWLLDFAAFGALMCLRFRLRESGGWDLLWCMVYLVSLALQVWSLVALARSYLQKGYTMLTVRDGDYYCTYFLWFENELVCEGAWSWEERVSSDQSIISAK